MKVYGPYKRKDGRIENFQILTTLENNQKSVIENGRSAKYLEFVCPVCGNLFSIPERRYNHNQLEQGKSGPFCSKRCVGLLYH